MNETQNTKISLIDAIDYLNAVRKQNIRRLTDKAADVLTHAEIVNVSSFPIRLFGTDT